MPIVSKERKAFYGGADFVYGQGLQPYPFTQTVRSQPGIIKDLDAQITQGNNLDAGRPIAGIITPGSSSTSDPSDYERGSLVVRDAVGDAIAQFGHLGGLGWGGRDYRIPLGTYGLWGNRPGLWLGGYNITTYANSDTYTSTWIDSPGTIQQRRILISETLPLPAINVPSGRTITLEYKPHYARYSRVNNATQAIVIDTTSVSLVGYVMTASLNGAAIKEYHYLPGPINPTVNTYANVVIQATFLVLFGSIDLSATGTNTLTYIATRILTSHDVHTSPSIAFVSSTNSNAAPSPPQEGQRGSDPEHEGSGEQGGSGNKDGEPGGKGPDPDPTA